MGGEREDILALGGVLPKPGMQWLPACVSIESPVCLIFLPVRVGGLPLLNLGYCLTLLSEIA